jgi:hypothetical protein
MMNHLKGIWLLFLLVLLVACGRTSSDGEPQPWRLGSSTNAAPPEQEGTPGDSGRSNGASSGKTTSDPVSGKSEPRDKPEENQPTDEQSNSSSSENESGGNGEGRENTKDQFDVRAIGDNPDKEKDVVKMPEREELTSREAPVETTIELRNETGTAIYVEKEPCESSQRPQWLFFRVPDANNASDRCDIQNCQTSGPQCNRRTKCPDSNYIVSSGLSVEWNWSGYLYDQSRVTFSGGCERRTKPEIGDRIVITACWTETNEIQSEKFCDNIAFKYGDRRVVRTIESRR